MFCRLKLGEKLYYGDHNKKLKKLDKREIINHPNQKNQTMEKGKILGMEKIFLICNKKIFLSEADAHC